VTPLSSRCAIAVLLASASLSWPAMAQEEAGQNAPEADASAGATAASASFPVLLYKVDFEAPRHTAGAPPTLGGGAAPRYVPTRIRYGDPLIVASDHTSPGQALEFEAGAHRYDQLSFALASNLGTGGFDTRYPTYHVELTVTIEEPGADASQFAIVLDGPMAQQIAFSPDGAITALVSWDPETDVDGYRTEIGRFEVGVPMRVGIDLDVAAAQWSISLAETPVFNDRFPTACPNEFAGQCIRSLRLNSEGSTRARVDDVLVLDHELELDIRIRPDDEETNVIVPHSLMLIQVALMASRAVDTTRTDLDSLALGPSGAKPFKIFDQRDVDGNGFADLIVRFRAVDTGIRRGDNELCLIGEIDEVPFAACDSVRTRPRPRPQRERLPSPTPDVPEEAPTGT
jgi:hypothetical protein